MDHSPTWNGSANWSADWSTLASEFLQHSVDFDRRKKTAANPQDDAPASGSDSSK
jgi:hypothetical protein